jgi:hypothetical protein
LTSETAEARIYYTINEDELPPKPPNIKWNTGNTNNEYTDCSLKKALKNTR